MSRLFRIAAAALVVATASLTSALLADDEPVSRGGYLQHTDQLRGEAFAPANGWFLSEIPSPLAVNSGAPFLDLSALPDSYRGLLGRFVRVEGTAEEIDTFSFESTAGSVEFVHADDLRLVTDPGLADELELDLALRGVEFDVDGTSEPQGHLGADGTCPNGAPADVVPLELPEPNSADMFTIAGYVCGESNRYWSQRSGGFAGWTFWLGPYPVPASNLDVALLQDLNARMAIGAVDWTSDPQGGLAADGTCTDGAPALEVLLFRPPPHVADGFTTEAFVCTHQADYWAKRTGGFAGQTVWAGPFPLPAPLVDGQVAIQPVRVQRARIRLRGRVYERGLWIRMSDALGDAVDAADFDLGDGITALRIVRQRGKNVKLRIEVSPDAEPGDRAITYRGVSGRAVLKVRARPNR